MEKQELKQQIGHRLRMLRESLGYTQEQIVQYFDIGRANYSRMEKGEIAPGPTVLNTIRQEFDVSLDWLVSGTGEMFNRAGTPKKEKLDFGSDAEEVWELIEFMVKIPMVKHAILAFFSEYKIKNKRFLERAVQKDDSLGDLAI